jgi:hypothetical protein
MSMFSTNYTYTVGAAPNTIIRSDGATIPADPDNTDYLIYLQWVADGNVAPPPIGPDLPTTITLLSEQVDDAVAAVYSGYTRFMQEYLQREAAAQAYIQSNYTIPPTIWVTSYATAANVSNQLAAQTIMAQANQLNGAVAALGALRMRKYEIAAAQDATTAQTIYESIMTEIESIAKELS